MRVNGSLLFTADDGVTGYELWQTESRQLDIIAAS